MLRDVFYYGNKPNVHPREKFATSLEDARQQSTTEHFWIINEHCDYRNFDWDWDFEFLPNHEVWAEEHNNVWPSTHQKDSGTWLCPQEKSEIVIYRADVESLRRKRIVSTEWKFIDKVDTNKFDFSWHPDPTDPPYIYVWGNKWNPVQLQPALEYHTPGATDRKYMGQVVELLPNEYFVEIQPIDKSKFDMSWRPNPLDPPFIYKWGNKFNPVEMETALEYRCPGATEVKYMKTPVEIITQWDKWENIEHIDKESFDWSWRPDPREPPLIYQFGTQHQRTGGPKYVCDGGREIKYIDLFTAKRLPSGVENFNILNDNVIADFDYSWHPDDTEQPFIYVFGNNQYPGEIMPTIEYVVPGATQIKYVSTIVATLGENKHNWEIPDNVDVTDFDFSWVPNPKDPEYIYEFGTQWQPTGGPKYIVPGATETKYVDTLKARALPNKSKWSIPKNIDEDSFDYSWHPDATSPPYIYRFPTQWAMSGGPTYTVDGATEVKYVDVLTARAIPDKTNWYVPPYIDSDNFDFSWHPYVEDEPFVYQFGTQWQKTGGPKYLTPGIHKNSAIKYIDTRIIKAKRLPNKNEFTVLNNIVVDDFDYTWHPDTTEEPFIYVFGNSQHPAEIMPTIEYVVPGATQIKYVNDVVAKLGENINNWIIHQPIDEAKFDFSWVPNPKDPPYIYVWGNKYIEATLEPTIEYHVPDATEYKYMEDLVEVTPEWDKWEVPKNIDSTDFDFTWRPDPREPPFVYQFGTQWQKTGGPIYKVKGATEINYLRTQRVKILSNKENWTVPNNIDASEFDFSWHPDDTSPPYIYRFPTQWAMSGGPTYTVPGASEIKYVDDTKAKALPNRANWDIPDYIDSDNFDFSWHPYVEDEPYIYQFGTQWQKTGGPRYLTPGIHNNSAIKYIDTRIIKAKRLPSKKGFLPPENFKIIADFDYSWHPDDTEPPYIYHFGTQHQRTGGPRYFVDGGTEIKYVDKPRASVLSKDDTTNWEVPKNIDVSNLDFSWHPDEIDEPYIYQFGTQWQKTGGPRYIVPNATEIKYVENSKAKSLPNKENWVLPDDLIIADFDFSWHPDETEEPFLYHFGTQWSEHGGPTYVRPGATVGVTATKYINPRVLKATVAPDKKYWIIPDDIDSDNFDFSWHPHPNSPPYIYQFGTQHQKTGGPQYVHPSIPKMASGKPIGEISYVDTRVLASTKLASDTHWIVPDNIDVSRFDFSWHPDDTSPPTTYQFGTLLDKEDGPKYVHPNTMDDVVVYLERVETKQVIVETVIQKDFPKYTITSTLEDLINQHTNELFWALNPDLDYSEFDFDWRPNIEQSQYLHAFGSQDNINTQTYFVNAATWLKGFREINYVEDKTLTVKLNIDMFFVDRSNNESQSRFEKLKNKFPNIQKTRYLNSWVETINRCINRASSNLCWILNSELDYSDFDFNYYPNPWQMKMVHVFGTQWSHWGTTFMINRDTFAQDTKFIKIIEHLSNLNFVKERRAKATNILYDTIYIDHGNMDMTRLQKEGKLVIKYQNSYITTFQKMLDMLPTKKEHYIWVVSSICDYTGFDFTYICDPFAKDQLHVFPSDRQKFGDTFLVDINKLRELIDDMNSLEDYIKINYNQSQRVARLSPPVIITEGDTHLSSINTEFDFPYAVFVTEDNRNINVVDTEPMSLWSPESKNIQVTSIGGTRIVVPKEAKDFVETQLYDYPYIKTNNRLAQSMPLDIVFFSNGEGAADKNYEHLLEITKGLPNRLTRVDGVQGRVNSQHAAANASKTSWYFLVNGKLKVSQKFDFNWQPDRLQLPKHYIFHATNPVNGLKYGHQAIVANNKRLTLENYGSGLDFTMDSDHEIVKINSGMAIFNTSEWDTWRTAFRECIKLKASGTEENKERLEFWLTVAMGDFAQYSIDGAQHAVEYYNEVDGDFNKLRLSYDWGWLRTYYENKYKEKLCLLG